MSFRGKTGAQRKTTGQPRVCQRARREPSGDTLNHLSFTSQLYTCILTRRTALFKLINRAQTASCAETAGDILSYPCQAKRRATSLLHRPPGIKLLLCMLYLGGDRIHWNKQHDRIDVCPSAGVVRRHLVGSISLMPIQYTRRKPKAWVAWYAKLWWRDVHGVSGQRVPRLTTPHLPSTFSSFTGTKELQEGEIRQGHAPISRTVSSLTKRLPKRQHNDGSSGGRGSGEERATPVV